jgi:hypothetical protein
MSIESLDPDSLLESRRKAIANNIHPISVEELKALGEGLFPYLDHPWREVFFNFVSENSGSTFYHASTDENAHIIYCREKDKGMWFRPGSGMGPLQSKGLRVLKEIVEAAPST